jgi:hypothetical protein
MFHARAIRVFTALFEAFFAILLFQACAFAQVPQTLPADTVITLPRDLSPWGMFMAADIIVKAVMLGLAFASVLTWTIWFAKAIELISARRRLRGAIAALAQAPSWEAAATALQNRADSAGALVRATNEELRLSAGAFAPAGVP